MAAEPPPAPEPADATYTIPDDYQFDLDNDFGPSNELLDEVLTRAGEFALDTIEAVQEHPVLAASLVAAGVGAIAGLALAKVAQRRPVTVREHLAESLVESGLTGAPGRFGRWARGRAHQAVEDTERLAQAQDRKGPSAARQAGYVAQLLPLSLALLRNPLVRDLVAQLVAHRLRRS